MEDENKKPNVFPQSNEGSHLSEAEKQMIANRNRELEERGLTNKITNIATPNPTIPEITNEQSLIEPDFDSDFDVIPLPSGGKTYKNSEPSIKVSFMNASDENILTNPNLLKSGKFLEVLLTRKILNPSIKYKDLLVGDRDAIMIWLRSTGYGSQYPIEVMDPKEFEMFNTEIDLDELTIKKLELEPDAEGYFDYTLPLSKKNIKFKFLTVGDSEEIEQHSERLKKEEGAGYDLATFALQKQIVEVEGNRDPEFIRSFVSKLRMGDSRAFKKYVSENECGVDMNITVQAPGGGQVKTFFPINQRFFWPDL